MKFNKLFFCIFIGFLATRAISMESTEIFRQLNKMRKENLLTDFKIISQDKTEHNCHRALLGAYSPYFMKMLINGFKEGRRQELELPYSKETINIILDFIYDPTKIAVEIEPVPFSIYIELINFTKQSFSKNLTTALGKTIIDINNNEILALEYGILYDDENLLEQSFNKIKDSPPSQSIEDLIINNIETNNMLIIKMLKMIWSSTIFEQLLLSNKMLIENKVKNNCGDKLYYKACSMGSKIHPHYRCQQPYAKIRTKEYIFKGHEEAIPNAKSITFGNYVLSNGFVFDAYGKNDPIWTIEPPWADYE